MQQADRTILFNTAYALDLKTRLFLPKKPLRLKPVDTGELERLQMQEKIDGLVIMFTEKELVLLAETIREVAARDEERICGHRR